MTNKIIFIFAFVNPYTKGESLVTIFTSFLSQYSASLASLQVDSIFVLTDAYHSGVSAIYLMKDKAVLGNIIKSCF